MSREISRQDIENVAGRFFLGLAGPVLFYEGHKPSSTMDWVIDAKLFAAMSYPFVRAVLEMAAKKQDVLNFSSRTYNAASVVSAAVMSASVSMMMVQSVKSFKNAQGSNARLKDIIVMSALALFLLSSAVTIIYESGLALKKFLHRNLMAESSSLSLAFLGSVGFLIGNVIAFEAAKESRDQAAKTSAEFFIACSLAFMANTAHIGYGLFKDRHSQAFVSADAGEREGLIAASSGEDDEPEAHVSNDNTAGAATHSIEVDASSTASTSVPVNEGMFSPRRSGSLPPPSYDERVDDKVRQVFSNGA